MEQALLSRLHSLSEEDYRRFILKLTPDLLPQRALGIRLPHLKKLAKEFSPYLHSEAFLHTLPHRYHEADLLHAFVFQRMTDLPLLLSELRLFLPHVNNWIVCDSLRPKLFSLHPASVFPFLQELVSSSHPYTCRFGMEMLMLHFLDEAFDPVIFSLIATQQREHYYVKMMQAWYFATALTKRFDETYSFLLSQPLPRDVQNKTVQKARESRRLTQEQKQLLLLLKRHG